jgi:multicomponent Na+:H+ antiporter subunit F
MAEALLAAAGLVLATAIAGLLRALWGPTDADRMMAAQLLGTGGIATLLLVASATEAWAVLDAALVLAVLSPFASVAFIRASPARRRPE